MKKKIFITESQLNMILSESLGVPNDIIEAAKAIVKDITENHLDLEEDYDEEYCNSFEEYMQDTCEDFGIEEVWLNDDRYYYGFYYGESSSKGQYDHDNEAVMINYKNIQNIIDRANIYQSNENLQEYIETSLYEYLMPIITHELTHSKDEEGEAQGKWIGACYKGNEQDLRDILYHFSENEMNARVGSVGGLVTTFIEQTSFNIIPEREDFDSLLEQIMSDDDLCLRYMELLIDMLNRDAEGFDKTSDKNNFKKYSLIYDLARNDNRLKNNRILKQLFKNNSYSAYDYVIKFYNKLYDNYRKRIMRAVYYIWQNIVENNKELENEE